MTVDCLRASKSMETATATVTAPVHVNSIIDTRYYLLAIFDEIMTTCAEANGCRMWMCKSMGMSQYYDMLLNFYGKERLRFVYLVRDPRDVTLSFMKTPVGDCHPYTVAKKWATLQNHALQILSDAPELVHQVRYEHILQDKVGEVAKINKFMGSRGESKTLRRGSVVVLADDQQLSARAKSGREASSARRLSYQFKNLGRGDSFTKKQFAKYLIEMEEDDMHIVESVALEEMTRLGYNPHLVGETREAMQFTDERVEEFAKLNKELVDKMISDLAEDNPDDLSRRQVQGSVLKAPLVHFQSSFQMLEMDREKLLDDTDDEDEVHDSAFKVANIDFAKWPRNSSQVGYLTRHSVTGRLQVEESKTVNLGKHMTMTFAAASQRGYYPSDRNKPNQDAYLSGVMAVCPDTDKSYSLFSVFDGHGDIGDECARITRDMVEHDFVNGIKTMESKSNNMSKLSKRRRAVKEASFVEQIMTDAYLRANEKLSHGNLNVNSSGTTAVSLCVCSDSNLYVANVGDSRCILISKPKGGELNVQALTNDHSPDREDEKSRIEKCGGVVMTSEQYDVMDPTMYSASSEPRRVWSKEGKWPGAAFSRSIGDALAKDLGVIAEPECTRASLTCDETMFVVGSDGIFDFITNEDVAEIVDENSDPADACRALVGMSYQRWSEHEERTDDITIVVGNIRRHAKEKFSTLKSLRRTLSLASCTSHKTIADSVRVPISKTVRMDDFFFN